MVGGMRLVNPTSSVAPTTTGKGKVSQQEVSRRVVSIDRLLQVVVEKMSSFEEGQKSFSKLFIKKMGEQTRAITQLANLGKKNQEIEEKKIAKEEEKDYEKLEKKTDASSTKQEKTSLLSSKGMGTAINAGVEKMKFIGTLMAFAIPAIAALVNAIVKHFDKIKKFWQENVVTPLVDGIFWVKEKIEKAWEAVTEKWQEYVITPVVDSIISLEEKFNKIWDSIKEGYEGLIGGIESFVRSKFPWLADQMFGKMATSGSGTGKNQIESNSAEAQEKFKQAKKKDVETLETTGVMNSSGEMVTKKDNEEFGAKLETLLPGGKENYLYKIAEKESSLGKDVVSGYGTARGMMQINQGTAEGLLKNYGGKGGKLEGFTLDDRYDPRKSLQMAQVLDEENRNTIASRLGKTSSEVSDKEARLAYFLGGSRAADYLEDPEDFEFNEKEISSNPWLAKMSAEDAYKKITEGFGDENTTTTADAKRQIAAATKVKLGASGQETALASNQPIPPSVSAPPEGTSARVPAETESSRKMAEAQKQNQQQPQQTVVVAGGGGTQQAPSNVSNSSNVTNNYVAENVSPALRMMETRTSNLRCAV